MGLDTPVVHALNDASLAIRSIDPLSGVANALRDPPGKYGRKAKTQRNRRGLAQAVDYVV
jgi:hypothetical protein